MNQRIYLARFGNRNNAHNLLSHTGANPDLLGKVLWHTDAPPQGDMAELGEFPAGYRVDNVYVVQVTRPDIAASRPGMVETTAALIPLDQLVEVDLDSLLQFVAGAFGEPIAAPDTLPPAPPAQHTHPPGSAALASALLSRGRAVWTGPGFADAIACVWCHLSSVDRAAFAFTAAHHPAALSIPSADAALVAVAVPTRSAARWSEWRQVNADVVTAEDPARAAFFGDDGGHARSLAAELGVTSVRWDKWRHLAAAAGFLDRLDDLEHEETRALLQLLGLLQPDSRQGTNLKRRALDRLVLLKAGATYDDVRGLRGVPWDSAPHPPGLEDLLREWAQHALADPARADDAVAAITDTARPNGSDGLARALADALAAAAAECTPPVPELAAAALRSPHGATALTWMTEHAATSEAVDDATAAAVGAAVTPDWLPSCAAHAGLSRTHAITVAIENPVTAWQQQRRLPVNAVAEDLLAHRIGPAGTILAALALDDTELANRAGALVAAEVVELPPERLDDPRYQAVWAAAIRHGANPWRTASPTDAASALLPLLAQGVTVDEVLLDALSRTVAADLSHRDDRARLWPVLPTEPRTRFLAATAAALARRITVSGPTPEQELQTAMLDAELLGAVAHDQPEQSIVMLRTLPDARSKHAAVVARRGRFTNATATALAQLVVDRRWKRAAETICDLASQRPDLRPAASQVQHLFSTLERLRRLVGWSDPAYVPATHGELRDALHEVAAKLYVDGPSSQGIWDRAGGDEADLPRATSGRHGWGLALDAVLKGQRGAPTLNALLDIMSSDYPNNRDLKLVAAALRDRRYA